MKQRYLFGAIIASFCLGIALFTPAPSMAEGRCPPGYFPVGGGGAGWEGCAPMGGEPGEGTDTSAPEWETRWGAIATGSGAFGAVENARSKKEAERIAMARCLQSTANARCKIREAITTNVWLWPGATRAPFLTAARTSLKTGSGPWHFAARRRRTARSFIRRAVCRHAFAEAPVRRAD